MAKTFVIAMLLGILIGIIAIAGCDSGRTRIGDITSNPDKYKGKDVNIAGEVVNTYEINIVISDLGAYQLDDGTGRIWVTTQNSVPGRGRQVAVKGTVSSGISFGGQSLGTMVRERERRIR